MNINVTKQSADNLGEPKLDANNKGYHMMRLMGWTGGGLGRLKQGREEPVGLVYLSHVLLLYFIQQYLSISAICLKTIAWAWAPMIRRLIWMTTVSL